MHLRARHTAARRRGRIHPGTRAQSVAVLPLRDRAATRVATFFDAPAA
jgi:hypothetical protein